MRTTSRFVHLLAGSLLICLATAAAAEAVVQTEQEAKEPPSWEALREQVEEVSMARYDPEDLAAQIDKKEEHLDSLYDQRAALEAQLVAIVSATRKSLEEIDAIGDPLLRNESLLRFRSSKDIRLKTIRATLEAVNEEIDRERRETAMLQRLLQGRRAEARLYGSVDWLGESSYARYLAAEAARVRRSEEEMLRRLQEERLARLEAVVLPLLEPRVPTLRAAVLWSVHE